MGHHRDALFSQIHEIVFHGKGGYDWPTVYAMPIWLRKLTFNKISAFYKKEAERTDIEKGELTNNNSHIPEAVKAAAKQNKSRGGKS